jgi:hypothetical protein
MLCSLVKLLGTKLKPISINSIKFLIKKKVLFSKKISLNKNVRLPILCILMSSWSISVEQLNEADVENFLVC